jgi:hypothetical protein
MPRRLPSLPLSGQPFDIYNLWLLHKFLPPLKEATPNAMFGVASFICKKQKRQPAGNRADCRVFIYDI